ncbi:hypothetical protein GBAR_LOCUS6536 [Geodia barretti]|uniref:Transketolase signature 1 domain-containing protein n=1 Tax=Geodia barretti TaxID=519541 RepID=A0AA35WCN1_GEOBA|nr:hypothetical protein GBAR_LOCUS6536 [Geodia barretti]
MQNTLNANTLLSPVEALTATYDRERFEDIGHMTCMTLVLLGNYAQTGHFGGPLAYTPYNVALHLAGPELGGLCYDYRNPKHPFCDKFMLAGGHNIPTAYALWMIMGEAMARAHTATGDPRYKVAPEIAMLPIDALGFRRGAGALKTLLKENDLEEHPLFAQAKLRGIRSLAGHSETTDLTNDVNGGPSGIGIATAAGKAAFWNFLDAPESLKVLALEGEFAMTEGHAQELKTQALAMQVGKRLRILLSYNNAGIDDTLVGGVIDSKYKQYELEEQWTSYGWNVFALENGNDYDQILAVLKTMEDWDADDRRPMIVIGRTVKGYWPSAVIGKIEGYGDQLVSYPSHPYGLKMNEEYFVALAETVERRYGVEFEGIRNGPVTDERERLIQLKTNIDVVMSLLDQNGLGDWLANRLINIGDAVQDDLPLRVDTKRDPFLDDQLRAENLPVEPQTLTAKNPVSGEEQEVDISLFKKPGEVAGTRRAISEIIKWMNYVTDNRFITLAADLSESINVEHGSLWGHYNPITNPAGTRFKAPIQEAGNVSSAIGCGNSSRGVRRSMSVSGITTMLLRVYFAAAEVAARDPRVGVIIIEVARPDFPVADRNTFADSDLKAAAKGLYVIRDFNPDQPKHGYVVVQGSNSTVNLVQIIPRLEEQGINVKIIAAVSEELFDLQPDTYRQSVLPPEARYDLMVVSTGTQRVWPIKNLGPLTDAYSLTADWDNQWLTGGTEPDVITEAHLDARVDLCRD